MVNAGLILEGGGMRGVYTAGVLDFFLDKDLEFKEVYGVSAGSCHACSYLSKQRGRALAISIDYLKDPRYCGVRSLIRTGDLFGVKMCYDTIPNELNPYDYKTFNRFQGNFYAVMNIAEEGDHIVCSSALYGGTYNLYAHTIRKMGVEATFVDPDCSEEELNAAFRENTKAVVGETIANPALTVLDIEKFAKAAHAHGVPLIVDNTFATPINCRPFDWGADIVTHSTTKYMDGHAMTVGGAIVDSGNFDWSAHADKFPGLTQPDETYHGIVYTEKFGKGAYITKATAQLMRDLGSIQSPQNAFLLNIGLETLHLRMPRHCENAKKVASYLKGHDKVAWVNCAMLEGDKYHDLAAKYMPNGTCGVITFGLKGGRDASVKMMDNLKLAAIVTHVADARTCVLHPASHTHRQMNDQELLEAGVQPDLIRFSVGIENADDIIADLEQALALV